MDPEAPQKSKLSSPTGAAAEELKQPSRSASPLGNHGLAAAEAGSSTPNTECDPDKREIAAKAKAGALNKIEAEAEAEKSAAREQQAAEDKEKIAEQTRQEALFKQKTTEAKTYDKHLQARKEELDRKNELREKLDEKNAREEQSSGDESAAEEAVPAAHKAAPAEEPVPTEKAVPAADKAAPAEEPVPTEKAVPAAEETAQGKPATEAEPAAEVGADPATAVESAAEEAVPAADKAAPAEETVPTEKAVPAAEETAPAEPATEAEPAIPDQPVETSNPEKTPGGTHQVKFMLPHCNETHYDKLMREIGDEPKSIFNRSNSKIGQQIWKENEARKKQKRKEKQKSSKLYDKIHKALSLPSAELFDRRQRQTLLTKLCAQNIPSIVTGGSNDSATSGISPTNLMTKLDRTKKPFDAVTLATFAQEAGVQNVNLLEYDWVHDMLANQQIVANTPVPYTQEFHEALLGGGLHSISDSHHDFVWVIFTNDTHTHWAGCCSLQFRDPNTLQIDTTGPVLWFDDLENGGRLMKMGQACFFKLLSTEKWSFYSAEVVLSTRLHNKWKMIFGDGCNGSTEENRAEVETIGKGGSCPAGLRCKWKELQFQSEHCGQRNGGLFRSAGPGKWWDGSLPVQTCAISVIVMKATLLYYAGYSELLEPFIQAGLCPLPPTAPGGVSEMASLPKWDITHFRDDFASYIMYYRLEALFTAGADRFRWGVPARKPTLHCKEKTFLWPLDNSAQTAGWIKENGDLLRTEQHVQVDMVDQAMLLPASCPDLWNDNLTQLQTFVKLNSGTNLAGLVNLGMSTPSSPPVEPPVEVLTKANGANEKRRHDTHKVNSKALAILEDYMPEIFACAMVGQPFDLTKMTDEIEETGQWVGGSDGMEFTEESVESAEAKGLGIGTTADLIAKNICYTSISTTPTGGRKVIMAKYTGRALAGNTDRGPNGSTDKRMAIGEYLFNSHMMWIVGMNKPVVAPMQIATRSNENYDDHFDELPSGYGANSNTFAVAIMQPSTMGSLGAADQDTRKAQSYVLKFTIMQATEAVQFWNSHCRSRSHEKPADFFDDSVQHDGTIKMFSFVPSDQFMNWYVVDPGGRGSLLPAKNDPETQNEVHPAQERFAISRHTNEILNALAQSDFSKWNCYKSVRGHYCVLPVACI